MNIKILWHIYIILQQISPLGQILLLGRLKKSKGRLQTVPRVLAVLSALFLCGIQFRLLFGDHFRRAAQRLQECQVSGAALFQCHIFQEGIHLG